MMQRKNKVLQKRSSDLHICSMAHVCLCVYMYMCIYNVYIYTCMHAYVYTFVYRHMYVYMHIHIHITAKIDKYMLKKNGKCGQGGDWAQRLARPLVMSEVGRCGDGDRRP